MPPQDTAGAPTTVRRSSCSCPSAGRSCLVQTVSDPVSSCAQQLENPILRTLHNFPLSLQAALLRLPASCAFLTCSLVALLSHQPLTSPSCYQQYYASRHMFKLPLTISWLQKRAGYTGVGQLHWGPPLRPCLLCSWQTAKSQPSLC